MKKRTRYCHIIWLDIKRGSKNISGRYLLVFFTIFGLLFRFDYPIIREMQHNQQLSPPGLMDNVLAMLKGMATYVPTPKNKFTLPFEWIVIQFLCALLVFNYFHSDLNGAGTDILIRSASRVKWWLSKCIWNILSITGLYAIIYANGYLFSIIYAKGKLGFEPSVFARTISHELSTVDSRSITLFLLVMPLLTSITLSILQMCIGILTGPVISFMIILGINVLSAYQTSYLLPGNYSMLLRSNILSPTGLSFQVCFFINLVLLIAGIVSGCFIFNYKDILDKN